MEARIVKDHLTIQTHYRFGDIWFAECECQDHEAFCELPSVIEVQGHTLGKSAWNSDRNVAYYRDDKIIGRIR